MKTALGPVAVMYPIPIVLVGTMVGGRPNYATVGDCALMGLNPPLVCISLNAAHHTTAGVIATGAFSINIPGTGLLAKVDACGHVSGRTADKGGLFQTHFGENPAAPLIAECPVSLECTVVSAVSVEHRRIFVGRVTQTHADDRVVARVGTSLRWAALDALDPISYSLDGSYYATGRRIGTVGEAGCPPTPEKNAQQPIVFGGSGV